MLFGFLAFGMSYSSFIKENVAAPIQKPAANSQKNAIDQVSKKKTKQKQYSAEELVTPNLAAPGPAITINNMVAVNGGGNALPGSQLDFTITINNTGSDALGTVFQDILDPNLTLMPNSLKITPIAANDAYNCIGNVGITLAAGDGVLANDFSPDGSVLSVVVLTNPAHGTVNLNTNGAFTFNPAAGYSGTDSFTYTLTSASGKTNTGTVNITISTPIIFVNGAASTTGTGTLADPFKNVSSITGTASSPIFIYTGASGTNLTLTNNQKVIGQGAKTSLVTLLNLTVPSYSNPLPSTGGINPTFSVINLKSGNEIQGVTLTGSTASITGSNVGNLKVRDVSITGGGNPISVNLNGGGILDCIFTSISKNGSSAGISIKNATGSFEVSGTGNTPGSGGTIQNTTNNGAEFTSCTSISLKNMIFTNTGPFGIKIENLNNFTLNNSTLTNSGSNIASSETGGIYAKNLTGTCSITNSNINDSWGRGFYSKNDTGTLNFNVTNSQFKNAFNKANGGSNFIFEGYGSSNNTLTLKGNDFSNAKEYGLTLNFGDTSTNTIQIGGNTAGDGNTINGAISSPGSNGLSLQSNGNATVNYNIIRNTLKSSFNGSFPCLVGNQGTLTMNGRINFNIIEGAGINTLSNGIHVAAYGNANHITEISNNTITNAGNYGIFSEANDNGISGSGRMDATIKNNTITVPENSYANLGVVSYADNTASTMKNAANIAGNITNTPTVIASGTFNVFSSGTNSEVILQGVTAYVNGSGNRSAQLKTFWDANNINPGTAVHETGTGTIRSGIVEVPNNASASKMAAPKNTEETGTPSTENQTIIESNSNLTAKSSSAKITAQTITSGSFTLPTGKSTIITFSATINAANVLPANTCSVTNQASVSGSNFSAVNSNITTTSIKPANATVSTDTQNIACLGNTTVTLNATCPLGTTATWYTSLSGGTSFATGASVTATPSTNNTTYCVACETVYCASDRLLVKTITGTPSTSSTPEAVSACDSYTWPANGIKYTASGTYTYTVGCDTKTLNLTITPSTIAPDEIVAECDSYTWPVNGTKYTTSGTYTEIVNCETRTLKLTITPNTSSAVETKTECDSYTWPVNGTKYTTSGIYTHTVGCNTKTLNLTITNSTSSSQTESACDSYTWPANGIKYTASGTYTYAVGCDTKTLNLTITPSTIAPDEIVAECDSYTWPANGTKYTTSGTYTEIVNCETRTLKLTITPNTSSAVETKTECDSYTWPVNGTKYTTSGIYTHTVGCNTKTLNLTITNSTNSSQTESACDSYTWPANGIKYTSSGTYTYNVGCDTKTLNLTITNSTSSSQTESTCDSYTWPANGIKYTVSGIYTHTVGCNTKTLNLTITNSTSSSQTESACDSYTWPANGIKYTSSGTYTYTVGCDTKTLNLTITPSTVTPDQIVAECDSYTWPVNGTKYIASGTYTEVVNCETKTLKLTITPKTSSAVETKTECDSYTWPVNGTKYTTSGIYTHTVGCNTKTLNLTITNSTSSSQTESACDSYIWSANGIKYTSSGTYTYTAGCETKTLFLTINNTSVITKTVSLNSGILSSNHSGASYQWFKCPNTMLTNETNQSYTPLTVGDYKVEITVGDCKITSDCITVTTLGLDELQQNQFKLYPNPSKGIINIVTANKGNYNIIDQSGKIIKSVYLDQDIINTINMENVSDGVYILKNNSDHRIKAQKIIISK